MHIDFWIKVYYGLCHTCRKSATRLCFFPFQDNHAKPVITKSMVKKWLSANEAIIIDRKEGKSDVWKLFGNVQHDDDNGVLKGFVACKACKQVYIYQACDGTQSLRKHHCDVGQSGPLAQRKPVGATMPKSSFNWAAAGFKATADLPRSVKVELNRSAVTMCALDFRPLNTVTGTGFQSLAQSLVRIGSKYGDVDISKLLHHPSTYSRRLLPKMASEVRQTVAASLVEQFQSMPKFLAPAAFVCDHWTDQFRQTEFTSIGVYFVDKNFTLHSYDLCVKEYDGSSKHAANIRADLMEKLQVYVDKKILESADSQFVIVSDSDAKLVAAVKNFDRISCAVHDLSLCVKAALKSVENTKIGNMIEESKVLVRFFKKSGMNRDLSKTLKQEVPTRFNSIYTMLASVDAVYDEITAKLTAVDNLHYMSNIRRKTLQAVCKELKRFLDATQKLAVEKEETLHLVHPVLFELQSKLVKQADKYAEDGEQEIAKLCSELCKSLKDKCLSKLTWYHIAATVLYPPFRGHPALESNEADVDRVRQDLSVMLADFDATDAEQHRSKKARTILPDSDCETESDDDDNNTRRSSDVDRYFTTAYECDFLNPLEFWKSQCNKLPGLSAVARSIFAIPASQNKTERSFSAASHILTDPRNSLDPDHLDELVLLRSHYKQNNALKSSKGDDDKESDTEFTDDA